MEADLESVYDQLVEIEEWLEENEMGDALQARAEMRSILERISSLHLRIVP